jgi:hypothetical protein
MLSLTTHRNFLTLHSLLLFCCPGNHRAAATCCQCCHHLPPVLSPPAVFDLGPGAHSCLVPGLRGRRRLNLGLRARSHRPLPQAVHAPLLVTVVPSPSTLTLPPSERVVAVLFLKPLTGITPPSLISASVHAGIGQ